MTLGPAPAHCLTFYKELYKIFSAVEVEKFHYKRSCSYIGLIAHKNSRLLNSCLSLNTLWGANVKVRLWVNNLEIRLNLKQTL